MPALTYTCSIPYLFMSSFKLAQNVTVVTWDMEASSWVFGRDSKCFEDFSFLIYSTWMDIKLGKNQFLQNPSN